MIFVTVSLILTFYIWLQHCQLSSTDEDHLFSLYQIDYDSLLAGETHDRSQIYQDKMLGRQ